MLRHCCRLNLRVYIYICIHMDVSIYIYISLSLSIFSWVSGFSCQFEIFWSKHWWITWRFLRLNFCAEGGTRRRCKKKLGCTSNLGMLWGRWQLHSKVVVSNILGRSKVFDAFCIGSGFVHSGVIIYPTMIFNIFHQTVLAYQKHTPKTPKKRLHIQETKNGQISRACAAEPHQIYWFPPHRNIPWIWLILCPNVPNALRHGFLDLPDKEREKLPEVLAKVGV